MACNHGSAQNFWLDGSNDDSICWRVGTDLSCGPGLLEHEALRRTVRERYRLRLIKLLRFLDVILDQGIVWYQDFEGVFARDMTCRWELYGGYHALGTSILATWQLKTAECLASASSVKETVQREAERALPRPCGA